jgi:hypothetical protein
MGVRGVDTAAQALGQRALGLLDGGAGAERVA